MNLKSPCWKLRRRRTLLTASLLSAVGLCGMNATQAQTLYFEDFEGLALGPNREEALAGSSVWTATPPGGWLQDNSGVPGFGTPDDGVVEWAGFTFANKDWWVATAGDQRRSEFVSGFGTVMIADPDEWDDAHHAFGLYNAFVTTPEIPLGTVPANSLMIAFDSSWRPEGFDDGPPGWPGDSEGNSINNQTAVLKSVFGGTTNTVLHWDSKGDGEFFHDHSPDENVLLPLNNPAGVNALKLVFSMEQSANDWWWAVDNIAIGQPPFLVGLKADGVQFTARIAEGLGKTVDASKGFTVTLDGQAVTPGSITHEGSTFQITYSQAPKVWTPKSSHTVVVSYTSNEGKFIRETRTFVAPSYTAVTATPTSVAAAVTEPEYFTVAEGQGITLKLDGQPAPVASTVRSDKSVVVRASTAPFAPNSSHVLELTFKTAAGTEVVDAVQFTAPDWKSLPTSLATAPGTGANAGVRWRSYQTVAGLDNTVATAEKALRGELGANVAAASGEADGWFLVDFVNFDTKAGDAGNFNSGSETPGLAVADTEIPGIPGSENSLENFATEAWTFVELPAAGFYTMVVNCDDGFQVSVGTTNTPTSLVLGAHDNSGGQKDYPFYFQASQPGVYFFRLLYFQGGGDGRVEWFTVNADGSYALVNGAQPGALKSFRNRTVPEPVPSGGIESVTLADGKVVITYSGTLKSAATLGAAFQAVPGATSPFQVTPAEGGGQQFYRAE